ncbi:MAG: phage major capsid protein [Alphaproteobacteria bacterium]|nr:phage major capsid protein [Alphaproteobacteria bacterium]
MTLAEIRARRKAIKTELEKLTTEARSAGQDELTGDAAAQWDKLRGEDKDLEAREARAVERDEFDRKATGKPIDGNPETRELQPGDAWALTPKQRMADYVARSIAGGSTGEPVSAGRLIGAMLTGNWRGAEREQRAMGSVPATAGGYFLPETVGAQLIDLARNASVLTTAGALSIPMSTPSLRLVRVLSDPTAQWRNEGAVITESDATFGAINIQPTSLAALVRVNNELLEDVPNFAATIEMMLSAQLGLKLDYAGLYGAGVNAEPLGLRQFTGLNEIVMGTNGAQIADYDKFLDAIKLVEDANGAAGTVVYAPRTKNTLAKLVTGISGDKTKLAAPADYSALQRLVSNQISIAETQGSASTASTAFVGDFAQMGFAIRSNIQIEASRVSDDTFKKNQTQIRAIMRADVAIFRPTHFTRIIGIIP